MEKPPLPDYVLHLLRPDSYPHPVERVDLLQTHVSYILFAGDYVYKWKKPVSFGFLDFSDPARRRFFCEEEVRLNRRLCEDMYLGVVQINRDSRGFRLDGEGDGLEYGVKMQRLPAERMMDRVIVSGQLQQDDLTRIVQRLVPFYAGAERKSLRSGYGSTRAVGKTINDNFTETDRFVGGPALGKARFSHIRKYTEAFLKKDSLFAQRIAAGRVRDCHGDLHSANICLDEHLNIFDCIEFNASLRCTDVAADVAFLAMDLDYSGLWELSEFFITRFMAEAQDEGIRQMLDFYKCYRAYVRGKIGLLTAADPGMEQTTAAAALASADRYFQLAEEYALH